MNKFAQEIIDKSRTINEKKKNYAFDKDINDSYLKEWRNIRTLLSDEHFEEMLKIENMTKHEFAFALQPEHFEYKETDQWFDDFSKILSKFCYDKIDYSAGISVPSLPFLYFLTKQLEACVNAKSNIVVENHVIISFIEAAQAEMLIILGKLIALELELYKQEKSFTSKDGESRFTEFLEGRFYSKNSFLEFYKKYPVAARLVVTRTNYLKTNFEYLLKRVDEDYLEISKFLDIKTQKLNLTQINVSTGDSHEQGKTVAVLYFDEKKLVYKPRRLQINESFQMFFEWCQTKSNLLDLKVPKGLYYETYAYQEYIEKGFCQNEESVERFYVRYGYLVAICYLLGINDLHLENVIAMGEHPVIVDIETMFQPEVKFKDESLYVKLVKELELDSVSNSCLLPKKLNIGIKGHVELSALNGKETKLDSQFFAPTNLNTDEFRYEKKDAFFKGGDNIPMFDEDKEVDYQQYLLHIVEGFNAFMQLVMAHKSELIETISIFKNRIIRILTKGTEQYASMIRYADHPNYNIEMKYRERLMMNIWAYPYGDKRLVKSEVRDMLFNDIPIFFTETDSKDIIDSKGIVYKNYFEHSGLDDAINRIRSLNEKEVRKQRMIMISSLGLANPMLNEDTHMIKMQDIHHHFDYLAEAEHIAQILTNQVIVKDNEASFISIDCDENNQWKAIACDESFYNGLSGISTFFLFLYKKTKKEEYLSYYEKMLQGAINQAESHPTQSAFVGRLSPIYPMLLEYKILGTIFNENYIKKVVEEINDLSEGDVKNISDTDYLTGITGMIKLMKEIKIISHVAAISNDIYCIFVKVLKERVARQAEGVNRVGIAHGLSGIALSLSTIDAEWSFAEKLLEKEMALKVIKENSYKWCWGLSGMIQARVCMIKNNPSIKIEKQLFELIKNYETLFNRIPKNDTLCHGNGSILTTLKCIYEYTGESKWKDKINVLLSNMKQRSMVEGYAIPRLFDVEAKGLFDGLGGVGFSYLYALGNIPNLLLVEIE